MKSTVKNISIRLLGNKHFRIAFIALGIIGGFLVFGIMQEKITSKSCYGGVVNEKGKCEGGEKFEFEMTLVAIFAIWYAVVAGLLLQVPKLSSKEKDLTHQGWFAVAGVLYLSSMVCGMIALRWINYPTRVIAKSSKPIPVLIIGVLLTHKRYMIQKYFFVLMIVVGVVVFIYDGSKQKADDSNHYLGLILIGIALLSDGVLGAVEDRMRAKTKPSALKFMFSINMYTALLLAIGIVATGEVFKFYEFASKYPDLYGKIAMAALSGSFGQIFIFMMISEFGPLPCAITTTLRKFFTVIISVVFMGNPLTLQQYVATAIIFLMLFADVIWGKKQLCGQPKTRSVSIEGSDVEKDLKIVEKI